MGWTAGADKSAGDVITHTIWNNYMGAAGSLEYLYALAGAGGSIPTQSEGSGSITVVTAAGATTKGAWAQMIASTAFASMHLILSIINVTDVDYATYQIDLGTGAGASEVVKVADLLTKTSTGLTGARVVTFCFPFSIAASTRVAIRAANMTNATALTLTAGLTILG